MAEIFNKLRGRWISLLHSRSDTFSLKNVRFRKQKNNIAWHIHKTVRSLLSGIHKEIKTCIFRRKFLATTICHLATENVYLVASWRPYKKVNFGPWILSFRTNQEIHVHHVCFRILSWAVQGPIIPWDTLISWCNKLHRNIVYVINNNNSINIYYFMNIIFVL